MSFDTSVERQVVVVLRPNRVSFSARVTLVPAEVVVFMRHVFPASARRRERKRTLGTWERLVPVLNSTILAHTTLSP